MSSLFSKSIAGSGLYAEVAPDRAVDFPDVFTYAVPDDLAASLSPGDRVTVPLGRGSTPTEATVVRLTRATDLDPAAIKQVSGKNATRLPEPLTDLAIWLARYYCTPLGTVFASLIPAAVKRSTGMRTVTLIERRGLSPDDLDRKLPPTAEDAWRLIEALPPNALPAERKKLVGLLGLSSAAPLGRLEKLGLLRQRATTTVRAGALEDARNAPPDTTRDAPLTEYQRSAVDEIGSTLGTFAPHVLLGVTGSGKTEVYLRLIERVLERGEAAIVLVPEISLTPQTAGRFIARFANRDAANPNPVAVLHSGLTASQRNQQWRRIADGHAPIVVGARSAVFAPMPRHGSGGGVGLIIVDEEHDGSYKQDRAPRYHARDVALKRAQLEGCPVVLGSATPSLESWRNARPIGDQPARFNLVRLPTRVHDVPMPRVTRVDLNEERRNRRDQRERLHAIGPTLERALHDALDRGDQAILLLNRRGYASYVACPSPECGFVLSCGSCDANLVHHRHRLPDSGQRAAYVKCHHCLQMTALPPTCPDCGRKLTLLNFGTQRLESELREKFAELADDGLLRLDSDTMTRAADYHDALTRFRAGRARVLVGTQMIAKGLDFPNVSLVGVVNADTALNIPDFRATERTFQLVAQVAGRAGRVAESAAHARVIVQSMEPDHPAIVAAADHDYERFANSELEVRAMSSPPLPPVGRMARIVFRHTDYDTAMGKAIRAADAARAAGDAALTVRGPYDAPIARIAEHHRIALELHAESPASIQRALTHLRNSRLVSARVDCAVDVDPLAMM